MLQTLVRRLQEDDPGLAAHGHRVAGLAHSIGTSLGLGPERLRRLHVACTLHDIGKVDVDQGVLWKPGPLVGAEWDEIRRHPELGYKIVRGLVHAEIAETVLCHHERFDGTGYPHGRRGDAIPLLARILTVADAFDAMTSDRCYQPALSIEFALNEIQAHAGSQFDPRVVEALQDMAHHGLFRSPERELEGMVAVAS
ncbi:MAG: HD-GYP domain-containing protein [Gemmatimonadota bacterium]|nr:HD-GYP domain-containing protein [Gemmatimonadota bacterium]